MLASSQSEKTLILMVLGLLLLFPKVGLAKDRGFLNEFCDSSTVTHYFYSKGSSKDVSHVVSYHKRLRRNIVDSPVDLKEGNKALKELKEASRLGMVFRCEKVARVNPFKS